MKYCEDCKWLREGDRCGHATAVNTFAPRTDLVRPDIAPDKFMASVFRMSGSASFCGPDARHFEPKEGA